MNPQKKRLEQLKARREAQEAAEKQQLQIHNSKSKKKMTSGEAVTPEETNVKMSAEGVDYEYSVEEDYEDEEYKSAKNEIVNKLLIEEKRLKKSARLAVENEKKLNSVLEEFNKRFDDFESLLDQMLEEVAGYKKNSMVTYTTMLESNILPLLARWQAVQKAMKACSIRTGAVGTSGGVFGNLAHYGIFILRKVLFYMAYCRDMIPRRVAEQRLQIHVPMDQTPLAASPKTQNSSRNVSIERE
ncbi:hypothetical protein L3Y34_005474 [Caenorhabditis briggsae]|uniref:Uncharacterized protein n=1 Tax=Caenorhabditis briggsae TaxID=6238 RepID=A0AAE9AJ97_CAEBR|nr:hypothetical protein L3Y34_005474 [Caenorhabditis briggsae]